MKNNCDTCYWADQCSEFTNDCEDYSPLQDDIDDLLSYAFDLVDRANTYRELIEEMEGNA